MKFKVGDDVKVKDETVYKVSNVGMYQYKITNPDTGMEMGWYNEENLIPVTDSHKGIEKKIMKQMLKETIIEEIVLKQTMQILMVIIIGLVFDCIVVGAPILFLYYVGFGNWQIAVCGLWLTFWVAFAVATEISRNKGREQ